MLPQKYFQNIVYFFVPSSDVVQNAPLQSEQYWEWVIKYINSPGRITEWEGPLTWTVLTYLRLKDKGLPVQLTSAFPKAGIVITHSDFLNKKFLPEASRRPSPRINIVEIKPDRDLELISSNFVIVQNQKDALRKPPASFLINSLVVTYWPQPSLIPRDPARGDLFKNISFFGNPGELHGGLRNFGPRIKVMGLDWSVAPIKDWNNYSGVDAVVALRPWATYSYANKPASKLINAWLAGVPAILGPESAYRGLRRSPLDYLEAKSVAEVIENLEMLCRDAALRQAMIENGRKRAEEFTPEKITMRWEDIIFKKAVPYYVSWTRSPLKRCFFFMKTRPSISSLVRGSAECAFLSILREAQFADEDWEALYEFGRKQGLLPALYKRLCDLKSGNVPPAFLLKLKNYYISNLQRNLTLERELFEILGHFAAANIPVIPLKGPVLAKRIYGDLALRVAGCDLDILIRHENIEAAEKILCAMGYGFYPVWQTADFFRRFRYQIALHKKTGKKNDVILDLHWGLRNRFTPTHSDDLWLGARPADLDGSRILMPSNEDLFLFLVLAAISDSDFVQIRYLYDIHTFIAHPDTHLDWDVVTYRAGRRGLTTVLFFAMKLSMQLFATPIADGALKGIKPNFVKEAFLSLWLNKANVLRPENKTASSRIWRHIISSFVLSRNTAFALGIIFKKIFLPVDEVVAYYNEWPAKKAYSLYMERLLTPILRKKKVQKTSLHLLYEEAFARGHLRNKTWVKDFCGLVLKEFAPKSIIDFGCGTGDMLAPFEKKGLRVLGIDGSRAKKRYSKINPDNFLIYDLRNRYRCAKTYDICLCVEVAEHLPEECADSLLYSLTHSSPTIIFTAAPPEQEGRDHYNSKPYWWWVNKFKKFGFELDEPSRQALKKGMMGIPDIQRYYIDNLLVFRNSHKSPRWPIFFNNMSRVSS